MLAWIDSGAPLFREHGPLPPRHLAVYFAVLDPVRRSVLQVDHRKAKAWVFAGGHVDTEPPAAAVVREAKEELGIDARFHPMFADRPLLVTESRTRPPGEHVDVTLWYVLEGRDDMALTGDLAEFQGLRWASIDQPEPWVGSCYAPSQVGRFLDKVMHVLNAATAPAGSDYVGVPDDGTATSSPLADARVSDRWRSADTRICQGRGTNAAGEQV